MSDYPPDKPMFKIGDRIIMINDSMSTYGANKYDTATVLEEFWCPYVRMDKHNIIGHRVAIDESCAMLLTEYEKLSEIEKLLL